ncbi:phage head closure protein [Cytobacillus oceanisediminis]|uniref:phage head closure protein n=1 Tax=Cytobacillus oceanisediminis TaxID=665099 RepID=UPI00203E897C|nr:phage head closure protein [Cytobacillus oceanisediminis]MCM3241326.1 phage head closure protein [Cytobacillus oceanisediminis]
MTYDDELLLIKHEIQYDPIGNPIPVEVKRAVLCNVSSVGRNEFYSAAVKGMKPEMVFVVNIYDYEKETQVEYEGQKYRVIRDYKINSEEIELTCEKVIGND